MTKRTINRQTWRRLVEEYEASGYTAEMTDELFDALGQCRGDHPRLAPYLREIEQRAALERQRRATEGDGWTEPPVETRVVPDPVMSGGSIE